MRPQFRIRRGVTALAVITSLGVGRTSRVAAAAPPTPQASAATESAERDYFSANGLLSRGLYELAAKEYRSFLAAHADHPKASSARYGLGVALFRLGKFEEAAKELAAIKPAADFEFAAETLFLLAQSDLELKRYDAAAAALASLSDQRFATHDLADDAAALLAETEYRQGRFADAAKQAASFAARWPESPLRERAEFIAALSQMAAGDPGQAARTLSDWPKRFPQGGFTMQAGLLLAQSLHKSGSIEQAVVEYNRFIEASKDEAMTADAMYGLAGALQDLKRPDDAAAALDGFLKRFPAHAQRAAALRQRAHLDFDAARYDAAAKMFQQAADAIQSAGRGDDRLDEIAYWLAKCDLRRERFDDAASRLEKAIAAWPSSALSAEMSYDRGIALLKAGRRAEASAALGDFASRFADHALVPESLYLRATIEHQDGHEDQVRAIAAEFDKRFDRHERAAAVAFLDAEADLLQDKTEAAAKKYRIILDRHPDDPIAPTATFRLGAALARLQRPQEAKPLLEQVVKARNTSEPFRPALRLLGDIAFDEGRWNDAAGFFGDFLSFKLAGPEADEAALRLGLAQSRADRPEDGLATLGGLAAAQPNSPQGRRAMFEAGEIELSRKNDDAAASWFKKLVSNPGDDDLGSYARFKLGLIAAGKDDDAAAAAFQQAAESAKDQQLRGEAAYQRGAALMRMKRYADASQAFETIEKTQPDHARAAAARVQHSIALARDGRNDEAISAIDAIGGSAKNGPKLDDESRASLLYEKAWCLRALKRPSEAEAALVGLARDFSASPLASHALLESAELAAAEQRWKDADERLTTLRAVIDQSPSAVPADVAESGLYRLATVKFSLEQFAAAADLAERFIADFPQSTLLASAHLHAGESLFRLGKHSQALAHFAAVTVSFADDPSCAPALLRKGECESQLQQWAQSQASFAAHLKRFADSEVWFQAQFGLGWALENQGKIDDAIAAYREVTARHGGVTAARAQFQIGECLFAKKQYEDAVKELLNVDILYAVPEWSAAALYEAGRCFEQLGRAEEAKSQYKQVAAKHADTKWAKLASERLAAAPKPADAPAHPISR